MVAPVGWLTLPVERPLIPIVMKINRTMWAVHFYLQERNPAANQITAGLYSTQLNRMKSRSTMWSDKQFDIKWVQRPRNSRPFGSDYDKPGDTATDRFDTTVERRLEARDGRGFARFQSGDGNDANVQRNDVLRTSGATDRRTRPLHPNAGRMMP